MKVEIMIKLGFCTLGMFVGGHDAFSNFPTESASPRYQTKMEQRRPRVELRHSSIERKLILASILRTACQRVCPPENRPGADVSSENFMRSSVFETLDRFSNGFGSGFRDRYVTLIEIAVYNLLQKSNIEISRRSLFNRIKPFYLDRGATWAEVVDMLEDSAIFFSEDTAEF